ncbi:Succinate-semialdehyde dehydrogenase, mitochondrial, partial [Orchesella cincta]
LAVTLNVATPLTFFGRAKLKTQFLQLSKHVGILSQSRMLHDKAFINGEWVYAKSGKTFAVTNPATQEVIATVPDMNHEDTELAIQAAKQAFNSWKNTTGKERAKLMRKWYDLAVAKQDELAKVLTLENGKPLKESVGEIIYSTDYLEFYAEEARRIHGEVLSSPIPSKTMILVREPIGVIGMLTPWNFPTAMIARKAAAAIASGCTCVIKPAEDTPLSALLLAEVANEAGIPPGVINVVTASRENTPSVGEKLCSSEQIAGISFTGSTAVGKILYKQCSSTIKRLGLELGGNAPFIIFESADLDNAVAGVMASKFRNTGQTCVSTNRILVHEKVHDQFVEKLKSSMASLVVGDGFNPSCSLGPLINKTQFLKVSALVQDALSKGAKKIVGGEPHQLGGTYYEPTLLTGINPTMQAYKEEIFGPVAMTLTFSTEEEALRIANDTRSGLASYFFSNDLSQIRRVSKGLEYGMVGINEGIISAAEAAFGGIKESGFGREGSKHGIDDYTQLKYLCFGNLS